jgi:predicted YcjX-like family ATPase
MMARRYESYKSHVVKPFFRDHFSRLDRQIVLVDALEALNAGGPAIEDLARALEMSLRPFRPGARSWLASVLGRRIDRVVFAATKADHLPSSSHDRLEATLRFMTDEAARRVAMAGASVHVLAMAAIRATREVEARERGERLACIKGVPLAGEVIGRKRFDGRTEVAIFPGDLPADPRQLLTGENAGKSDVRFVRFLPPRFGDSAAGPATWPHVRLDRALQLLLGDYLS